MIRVISITLAVGFVVFVSFWVFSIGEWLSFQSTHIVPGGITNTKDVYSVNSDASPRAITLKTGVRLKIPGSYIGSIIGDDLEKVAFVYLHATLPTFFPPEVDSLAELKRLKYAGQATFIELSYWPDNLTTDRVEERFQYFLGLTVDPEAEGPSGLTVRPFREGLFGDQVLVFNTSPDSGRYMALCDKNGEIKMCERLSYQVSGFYIKYDIPFTALADYANIDRNMHDLIHSFIVRPN